MTATRRLSAQASRARPTVLAGATATILALPRRVTPPPQARSRAGRPPPGRPCGLGVAQSLGVGEVIRRATEGDAAAIALIYNQGIEDRVATFETEPRSAADVRRILEEHGSRLPTVVVERDGRVVAFAWVSSY